MEKNRIDADFFYYSMKEPSLLDFKEDSEISEWYSIIGSEKIRELSRQLRTSINYKSSVVRIRFSIGNDNENSQESDSINILQNSLLSLSSQIISLLNMVGGDKKPASEKIIFLLKEAKLSRKNNAANLLKEIRRITKEIWKLLHILSEKELHYFPKLVKIALKIADFLCIIESAYNPTTSRFFEELSRYYNHLESELSFILQEDTKIHNNTTEKEERVRTLE